MSTIGDGMVVAFHYVLRDARGELLDDSSARETPMVYLHGANNLVPGLERALTGRAPGDRVHVTVPPEEAYGARQGEPLPVPRSAFPDDAPVEAGAQFMTRTADGRPMKLWVTKVEGDQVWLDPHHPLAGRTLDYDVRVLAVRPATAAEQDAGRPEWSTGEA